ncbi:MAG TPA: universal stress protein [Acidobacteriaceae bacterium]|nr:universal stress protein [Acidobacteriaceae bacterium]
MKTLDEAVSSKRSFVVPEKILVATDLEDSEYLLPHAIAQARACGSTLTLLHVIPPGQAVPLDAAAIPYLDVAEMKAEAEQTLKRMAEKAQAAGIECDILVTEGNPREQITTLARELHAGRIIAGTHGRRHLKKLLLGSVAHEILRSAEVPVCTIGPHAREASSFGAPQKILHPVSLCAGYESSARMAIEMAEFYRADITLLHVLSRSVNSQPDADRVVEWTRSELKRVIPDEAPLWTHPSVQVEIGDVVDEVLNVAAEMSADLIMLGVDANVSFWPIRGDDTVYSIIARAKVPVLSIRHQPGMVM